MSERISRWTLRQWRRRLLRLRERIVFIWKRLDQAWSPTLPHTYHPRRNRNKKFTNIGNWFWFWLQDQVQDAGRSGDDVHIAMQALAATTTTTSESTFLENRVTRFFFPRRIVYDASRLRRPLGCQCCVETTDRRSRRRCNLLRCREEAIR